MKKTLKETSTSPAIDAADENPVNVTDEIKTENDEIMKVEEAFRQRVRKFLRENEENKESTGIVPYEDIAKMIATDVAARTKQELLSGNIQYKDPTPKDPSVSFTKQYVDRVGFKIQYLREMDARRLPDGATELQGFVEEMVEEYIDLLQSSGALTPEDINDLQSNPEFVTESDTFRRFLGEKIANLPESWPDTSMPSFSDWVEKKYKATTSQNIKDRELSKVRRTKKADT